MNLINLWAVPPFMAGSHILCSEDEAFLIFSSEVWKPLLTARQQELREDLTNLFKIVLSNVLILCALCQEVQLCLYCSLFAMGAQSVFLGQPGLSVPTHLYGQAVFTLSTWFSDFCLWSGSNRVLNHNFCLGPNRIASYFVFLFVFSNGLCNFA